MSIKPSASAEIRALITALASNDEIARETAIARLAIIGPRAVERILAAYATAGAAARIAMLRTLEATGDPRALSVAREALGEEVGIAIAATGTLRTLLDSPVTAAATAALDELISAALDHAKPRQVRLAALDALQGLPHVRERVESALHEDPDAAVRARAANMPTESAMADAAWQEAVDGSLPDDPAALREAVRLRGTDAPLSVLQTLVDSIRERESQTAESARRTAWETTRGAVHQALALRGSRIALYDLRESLEQARQPLPPSFLTALHAVGDESCLAAIAAAHKRPAGDERWRGQLEAAFQAIVKREKLGRKKSARLLG